jgi:uncharacterized ion transporter superfamily protein YfcC
MKARKFPDALVIILIIFVAAGLLAYILPSGSFDRTFDQELKREIVVPDSYEPIPKDPLTAMELIAALPKGIASAVEIIVLILMVGGALHIVDKTGAFHLGITAVGKLLNGKRDPAIVLVSLVFAAGGVVEGLYEEIVPLVPAIILLSSRFGISNVLAVGMSLGSAVIGSAFSPINPFGAVLAQRIAGVPFLSGALFRTVVLAVALSIWVALLIRHARKDTSQPVIPATGLEVSGTRVGVSILTLVAIALGVMSIGLLYLGWGFNEMSGWFFLVGIGVGLIAGMNANLIVTTYMAGFRELTQPALLVGFAYSIPQVLKDGMVMDTIVYGLSLPLVHLEPASSAIGMMVSHAGLQVLLPSYTGQAALTLPILAPLSDIIGLSRDVCVLAFQYGAMPIGMIVPTSGALMAILTLAKIRYDEWLRFTAKPLLIMYLFAAAVLVLAGWLGV